MSACPHKHLLLLAAGGRRVRCRHCHLTIKPDELDGGYCPECYEVHGVRRQDFEEIAEKRTETVQYRCEDCGAIITS